MHRARWLALAVAAVSIAATAYVLLRPRYEYVWRDDAALPSTVNTREREEYEPNITPDGKHLIFTRGKAGRNADLFTAPIEDADLAAPVELEGINTEYDEVDGMLGTDGNLYFYSDRPGSLGGYDLYAAVRRDDGSFEEPVNLGPNVNSSFNDYDPCLSRDGRFLYFCSNRHSAGSETNYDLYVCLRAEKGWSTPKTLDILNTGANEWEPMLDGGGRTLYFTSNRPRTGKDGAMRHDYDLYAATLRAGGWSEPRNLGPRINSSADEFDPCISPAGNRLLYVRGERSGDSYNVDIWDGGQEAVPIGPILQPGEVDAELMRTLALLVTGLALLLLLIYGWQRLSTLQKCMVGSIAVHCLVAWIFTLVTMRADFDALGEKEATFVIYTDLPETIEQDAFVAAMFRDTRATEVEQSSRRAADVPEAVSVAESTRMPAARDMARPVPEREPVSRETASDESIAMLPVGKAPMREDVRDPAEKTPTLPDSRRTEQTRADVVAAERTPPAPAPEEAVKPLRPAASEPTVPADDAAPPVELVVATGDVRERIESRTRDAPPNTPDAVRAVIDVKVTDAAATGMSRRKAVTQPGRATPGRRTLAVLPPPAVDGRELAEMVTREDVAMAKAVTDAAQVPTVPRVAGVALSPDAAPTAPRAELSTASEAAGTKLDVPPPEPATTDATLTERSRAEASEPVTRLAVAAEAVEETVPVLKVSAVSTPTRVTGDGDVEVTTAPATSLQRAAAVSGATPRVPEKTHTEIVRRAPGSDVVAEPVSTAGRSDASVSEKIDTSRREALVPREGTMGVATGAASVDAPRVELAISRASDAGRAVSSVSTPSRIASMPAAPGAIAAVAAPTTVSMSAVEYVSREIGHRDEMHAAVPGRAKARGRKDLAAAPAASRPQTAAVYREVPDVPKRTRPESVTDVPHDDRVQELAAIPPHSDARMAEDITPRRLETRVPRGSDGGDVAADANATAPPVDVTLADGRDGRAAAATTPAAAGRDPVRLTVRGATAASGEPDVALKVQPEAVSQDVSVERMVQVDAPEGAARHEGSVRISTARAVTSQVVRVVGRGTATGKPAAQRVAMSRRATGGGVARLRELVVDEDGAAGRQTADARLRSTAAPAGPTLQSTVPAAMAPRPAGGGVARTGVAEGTDVRPAARPTALSSAPDVPATSPVPVMRSVVEPAGPEKAVGKSAQERRDQSVPARPRAASAPSVVAPRTYAVPAELATHREPGGPSVRRSAPRAPEDTAPVAHIDWGNAASLGNVVNSPGAEYAPNLSADGYTLFLTCGAAGSNANVRVSPMAEHGWSPPREFAAINTPDGDAIDAHVYGAGQRLIFYSSRTNGVGGYDLYVSFREDGAWGVPTNLGTPVNSAADDCSPCVSADGGMLLFASNRDVGGSQGGHNIYRCRLGQDGKWGRPERLGINSADWNDRDPALSRDGLSLYFASDRQGGRDGYDIWVSHRRDGRWQAPLNLGPGVNTANDEREPALSPDGTTILFATDRSGGEGAFDIWEAQRRLRPEAEIPE